ncbi:BIRC7_8 [Mytilus coruscus]|uniref:BIRC7_8 n=1 Tax=Mytilus coruscus TaxID=42192 RepID=A0A6J8AUB5_MYTCO|nr:BIRC7_8 [Mytilus coruscus]
MIFELARLETYKSAPKTLRAWRIKLAKAGFFYTGNGHKCRCAFCGFSYNLWTEADDPEDIHGILKPDCPFLTDRCGTSNIPMHADEESLFQRRSQPFLTSSSGNYQSPAVFSHGHVSSSQTNTSAFVEGLMEDVNSLMMELMQYMPPRENEPSTNLSRLALEENDQRRNGQSNCTRTTSREANFLVKYPEYATSLARLHSFKNWPSHLEQSPEDLTSAGFFYTGKEDRCRCFFCGGGLTSWEPNDDPWIEHARWYPNCHFVRQCKGDNFIDIHMNRTSPNADVNNQHFDLTEDSRNSVTKLNDFNKQPAVQAVSEIGLDEWLVMKAYDFLQEDEKTASIRGLEQQSQNRRDQKLCTICMDEHISIVFLPCDHQACCANCAPVIRKCPICRTFIEGTLNA